MRIHVKACFSGDQKQYVIIILELLSIVPVKTD
jgi:hypothetical protein